MSTDKSYEKIKADLDAEIAWFESGNVNIQDAVSHYKKAKKLLAELEDILNKTKLDIQKLD